MEVRAPKRRLVDILASFQQGRLAKAVKLMLTNAHHCHVRTAAAAHSQVSVRLRLVWTVFAVLCRWFRVQDLASHGKALDLGALCAIVLLAMKVWIVPLT